MAKNRRKATPSRGQVVSLLDDRLVAEVIRGRQPSIQSPAAFRSNASHGGAHSSGVTKRPRHTQPQQSQLAATLESSASRKKSFVVVLNIHDFYDLDQVDLDNPRAQREFEAIISDRDRNLPFLQRILVDQIREQHGQSTMVRVIPIDLDEKDGMTLKIDTGTGQLTVSNNESAKREMELNLSNSVRDVIVRYEDVTPRTFLCGSSGSRSLPLFPQEIRGLEPPEVELIEESKAANGNEEERAGLIAEKMISAASDPESALKAVLQSLGRGFGWFFRITRKHKVTVGMVTAVLCLVGFGYVSDYITKSVASSPYAAVDSGHKK